VVECLLADLGRHEELSFLLRVVGDLQNGMDLVLADRPARLARLRSARVAPELAG